MNKEDFLDAFSLIVPIKLAWGEMDALGHVNNIMFFRYFETSRMEYLEKTRFFDLIPNKQEGPILAETKCRFLKPLTFPGLIEVGVRVKSIGNTSLVMEHVIWDDRIGPAAIGEAVIVHYNYAENRKIPLPDIVKQAFISFEKIKPE